MIKSISEKIKRQGGNLSLKTDSRDCILAVDAGGTKIATAAVGIDGNVIIRDELASPAYDGDKMVEAFRDSVSKGVKQYRIKGLDVKAVGIAAAGYISYKEGVLVEAPNIAWRMAPLKMIAAEAAGLPAFLDNDSMCAAAGERFFGAAKGIDDFVCLTLGTGVGGGAYVGGRLLRGNRGMAAEFGHITIDPNGPVCGCGRKGCLEAFASGTALGRTAAELAAGNRTTLLTEISGRNPACIDGKTVASAAEQGDEVAIEAIKIWSARLGCGIANIIHIFDPKIVVLGGGVSESGHLFLGYVREAVLEHGIRSLVEGIPIVLSKLGNEAGIIGAAALAMEDLDLL